MPKQIMVATIRVRFSQLTVPRHQCKRFIEERLRSRDNLCVKVIDTHPESDHISYMPLSLLHEIQFLTMEDISTPTTQRLIGRLMMNDEESRYILASTNTDVVLYIHPKNDGTLVTTRIVLPLSMDARTAHAIHVPQAYSNAANTVPNEITWEFLNQLYSPHTKYDPKFPAL